MADYNCSNYSKSQSNKVLFVFHEEYLSLVNLSLLLWYMHGIPEVQEAKLDHSFNSDFCSYHIH